MTYFERELLPHAPDAWIAADRRDPKAGEVGLVGYEINFSRYWPRSPVAKRSDGALVSWDRSFVPWDPSLVPRGE